MRYIFIILISGMALAQNTDYQTAYSKSYRYEQQKNYRMAIKSLQSVYRKYSNDYELHLRLGWLSYKNRDHSTSSIYLRKAIKIQKNSIEARNMILLPLTAQKQWRSVKYYAQSVIQVAPLNYQANLRLAYALYLQGKFDNALIFYKKLHKAYPSDLDAKLGMAASYLKLGRNTEAAFYYSAILKVSPYHGTAKQGYLAATRQANTSNNSRNRFRMPPRQFRR